MSHHLPPHERLETALIALGTGLFGAAVLTAVYSGRSDDGLDWFVYGVGLAAAIGLLGVAVLAWRAVADPERRAHLVSWPGAAGAASVGAMVTVGLDDATGTVYYAGGAILLCSVLGHLIAPRPPFVLTGIIALAWLYIESFEDVFSDWLDFDGLDFAENLGMVVVAAIVLFTLLVTDFSRRFLPSRDFGGIVVGVMAVAATTFTGISLGAYGMLASIFAGFPAAVGEGDFESGLESDGFATFPDEFESSPDFEVDAESDSTLGLSLGEPGLPAADVFENDLWFLLAAGALLVGYWLWLAIRGGHVGYRVLAAVQSTLLVPVVSGALITERPAVWALVALLLGVVVLGTALVRALAVRRPPA